MKWWQFTKSMFMRYCEMRGFKTVQITEISMFGSRPCPHVCLSTNPNVGTHTTKDAITVKKTTNMSLEEAYKLLEFKIFFSPDSLVRNAMRDACPKRARFERDIFAD